MKLVFAGFESALPILRDKVNVLRIEDKSLYARCSVSMVRGFADDVPEPASFFSEDGKELNAGKILFNSGDVLMMDLNDKRIVTQAIKALLTRVGTDAALMSAIEELNYQIEDIFGSEMSQMAGDYRFSLDWGNDRYLKQLGFCVDDALQATLHDRLLLYLRVMSDLFPDYVISFCNLRTYLTDEQYNEFCRTAVSLQLRILSFEQGCSSLFTHLENGLFVDVNYLEY